MQQHACVLCYLFVQDSGRSRQEPFQHFLVWVRNSLMPRAFERRLPVANTVREMPLRTSQVFMCCTLCRMPRCMLHVLHVVLHARCDAQQLEDARQAQMRADGLSFVDFIVPQAKPASTERRYSQWGRPTVSVTR